MTDPDPIDPNFAVWPSIIVVPDGRTSSGALRLSLQVTPLAPPIGTTPHGDPVDLRLWPTTIAHRASAIRIHLANIAGEAQIGASHLIAGTFASDLDTEWPGQAVPGAQDLWTATFQVDGGFATLMSVLRGDQKTATAPSAYARAKQFASVLSPRVDVATLGTQLIAERIRVAQEQAERRLASKKGKVVANSVGEPQLSLEELQAWAIAGTAVDPIGKNLETMALTEQRRDFQSKVTEICEQSFGKGCTLPAWAALQSYAHLEAYHRVRPSGDADAEARAQVLRETAPQGLALLSSRVESLLLSGFDPPDVEPQPQVLPKAGEAHRRKLAAMLTYPSIGKYLGFVVDIEIADRPWLDAASKLVDAGHGAVAATFASATDANTNWTAFVQSSSYFGPCDIDEALGRGSSNQTYLNGVLNLGGMKSDKTARFELQNVDAANAALQQNLFARRALERMRSGRTRPEDFPDLRRRGVALVDTDAQSARDERLRRKTMASPNHISYAGDLVRGHKIAVAIAFKQPNSAPLSLPVKRWRSLVARHIGFGSQLPKAFLDKLSADPRFAEREDGYVCPVVGTQSGKTVTIERAPDEMMVWPGESLGLASKGGGALPVVTVNNDADLAIDLTFSLEPENGQDARKLPPLREGRSYVFAAVPDFVNGCSLPLSEAIDRHAANSDHHVLGGKDKTPFVYERLERIPGPAVLLPWTDRLVRKASVEDCYGEAIATLVVRTGGNGQTTTRRFLFPERVQFDEAEQQDLFAGDKSKVPPGVFNGSFGALMNDNGAFPLARGGKLAFPEDSTDADEKQRNRGLVLKLLAKAGSQPDHPYYPDSHSQKVRGHFSAAAPSDAQFEPMMKAVPFWGDKDDPRDARPLLIELRKPSKPLPAGIRGRVNPKAGPIDVMPDGGFHNESFDRVCIDLAPATIVEFDLVSEANPRRFLTEHFIGRAFHQSWNGGSQDEAALKDSTKRLEELLAQGPLALAQGRRRVRLVHAVAKPEKPMLTGTGLGLYPVVVTAVPKPLGKTTWEDVVLANQALPYERWPSVEGGTHCFFVGKLAVDPATTGSIRCEASWLEVGPDSVRRDGDELKWDPSRKDAQMFNISELSSALSNAVIDAVGAPAAARGLSYAFPDGRARRLVLKLIATSRFVDYFERKAPVADTLGDCEQASDPLSSIHDRWVPCTFRPAPPTIERIMPVFDYVIEPAIPDIEAKKIRFERRTRLRVELGPDCFSSGEGELLGLIFHAETAGMPNKPGICDYFSDRLKPFAAHVTRWGRDPIRSSPTRSVNLWPERFEGAKLPKRTYRLQAGLAPGQKLAGDAEALSVDVLGYEMVLDKKRGFYCDISLSTPSSNPDGDGYMPFVQLGLVRYQPHAVEGLELSLPSGHMVQILPRRAGAVQFVGRRKIEVELIGPVASGGLPSLVDFRVMIDRSNSGEKVRWRPATRNGKPLEALGVEATTHGGVKGWRWAVELPRKRSEAHLGILIEEYEQLRDEQTGAIIRRGPIFGQLIDFGDPDGDLQASQTEVTHEPVV